MPLAELLAIQFVLPSIPRVVALLLSELDQAEPNLRKVNQLISTDLALTARLLQRACQRRQLRARQRRHLRPLPRRLLR